VKQRREQSQQRHREYEKEVLARQCRRESKEPRSANREQPREGGSDVEEVPRKTDSTGKSSAEACEHGEAIRRRQAREQREKEERGTGGRATDASRCKGLHIIHNRTLRRITGVVVGVSVVDVNTMLRKDPFRVAKAALSLRLGHIDHIGIVVMVDVPLHASVLEAFGGVGVGVGTPPLLG